jgi:hypothetical protein
VWLAYDVCGDIREQEQIDPRAQLHHRQSRLLWHPHSYCWARTDLLIDLRQLMLVSMLLSLLLMRISLPFEFSECSFLPNNLTRKV